MGKTKVIVRLLSLLLSTLLLLGSQGCARVKPAEEIQIRVILKSMDINYWKVVIAGANIATTEYLPQVEVVAPRNEEDSETQIGMIEQAVADGCDAIVLSAIDFTKTAVAVDAAKEQGVKVIVIDSDVDTDAVQARIMTNNYRAGQRIGEHLVRNMNYQGVLGLVGLRSMASNGQDRQKGIIDTINRYPDIEIREVLKVDSDIYIAKHETEELLERNPDLTAIAAVNEQTTIGMGLALSEAQRHGILAVGFDNAPESMSMLEERIFDAVIVQNQYAMGYLGVEYAVKSVQGTLEKGQNVDTGITVVTRDNMFLGDMQTLIFPFG